jgi:hypothetical protein
LSSQLLRKGLGALFWRRSEVNRGQKGTDQRYQQIDLHVFLRCAVAANYDGNAKGVPRFNDSRVIKNG